MLVYIVSSESLFIHLCILLPYPVTDLSFFSFFSFLSFLAFSGLGGGPFYGTGYYGGGGLGALLVIVALAPGSDLAGKSVAEGIGAVSGATAVAVLRGEEMSVPRGPTRLEAGDQVIAVATPEAYARLRAGAAGVSPVG